MYIHLDNDHAAVVETYLRESVERQPWVFHYAQAFVHVVEALAHERLSREKEDEAKAEYARKNNEVLNTADPIGFDPDCKL